MCRLVLSNIWILTFETKLFILKATFPVTPPSGGPQPDLLQLYSRPERQSFGDKKKLVDPFFLLFLIKSSYTFLHLLMLFSYLSFNFFPLLAQP